MSFRVVIQTIDGVRWQGEATSLVAPASDGYFGVLPGHAPTLILLGLGVIAAETPDRADVYFAMDGGIAEIKQDRALLLTDWVSPPCSLEVARRYCMQRTARELL